MPMKKYMAAIAGAFLAGCGGTDESIVGSAYTLIDYYSDPATLPDDPAFTGEAPSGDYGDTAEAWVSDLYHGSANILPCYGHNSAGKDCVFPQFKQIDVTFQGQGAACLQHRDYITSHGGTLSEYSEMVLSFEQGLNALNGIGTGVVLQENSTVGTHMTIAAVCYHTNSDLGDFLQVADTAKIVDLPTAAGVNPRNATYLIPSQSRIDISFENIWDFVTKPSPNGCGFLTVGNPQRLQKLKQFAFHTGEHEALHMFGFGHFLSGLMAPIETCTDPSGSENIPTGFGQALGDYVGGAGGTTIKTGSINPTNVP